jgi:hypothetical protein
MILTFQPVSATRSSADGSSFCVTLNAKVKRKEIRERRVAAPADALKRVAQSDARQPRVGLRAAGPSHPKNAAATLTTSDALFNEGEL